MPAKGQKQVLWSPEKTEKLKKLMASGTTLPQAAILLDTTRNAIIGKLNRLKLKSTFNHVVPRQRKPKSAHNGINHTAVISRPSRPKSPPKEPKGRWVLHLSLKHGQCKWPKGDGPFYFCALSTKGHPSYCEYHQHVAYQPPRQR